MTWGSLRAYPLIPVRDASELRRHAPCGRAVDCVERRLPPVRQNFANVTNHVAGTLAVLDDPLDRSRRQRVRALPDMLLQLVDGVEEDIDAPEPSSVVVELCAQAPEAQSSASAAEAMPSLKLKEFTIWFLLTIFRFARPAR